MVWHDACRLCMVLPERIAIMSAAQIAVSCRHHWVSALRYTFREPELLWSAAATPGRQLR